MKQTSNTEKLVYVIYDFQLKVGDPNEISDESFKEYAINGGSVYRLSSFAKAYNSEEVSTRDTFIRII